MCVSQVALDRQMAEFLMVTDECKRVKGELVSYKQVMEKQQEHVDKLLSENFDLRYQIESLPPRWGVCVFIYVGGTQP